MVNLYISDKARQHVRDLLQKYSDMNNEINFLRVSIMNPYVPSEKNAGSGKTSITTYAVEEKAIKLATHEQIIFRAKALSIIQNVLAKSSDEAQKIIELKYFSEEKYSWVAISEKIDGYSEDGCRKIERKIVDKIAQQLGW